jgi:hypothetical protein
MCGLILIKLDDWHIQKGKVVATLAFGSRPRQGGCKVAGLIVDPGVTSHAPGSAKSVREWTLTLPNELPCWELGRVEVPETSESDLRGQISMACDALYINGKLLKFRCPKWARIAHLDIWNTSYGQKKAQESNSRESANFDSRPLKVGNRPEILGCRQRATYRWKAFDESYNFASDHIAIGALHKKLCALKVLGVPAGGISGLPCGSPAGVPGEKSHLDAGPVERHRVYYKGEGGGFPQVRAVVSQVSPRLPVALLSTKGAPTMH